MFNDAPFRICGAVMSGSCVDSGRVEPDGYSGHYIEATFTPGCAARFADFSEQNIGRPIAMLIDGDLIMMPFILNRIDTGTVSVGPHSTVSRVEMQNLLNDLVNLQG